MKEVFKFELFYKLLIYVIVLPVLSLLTGWFMKYIISESVIYNFDIIIKLLNIPGILGALFYALIILFFIYIEYVIVYKMLYLQHTHQSFHWIDICLSGIKDLKVLKHPSAILAFIYFVFLCPLWHLGFVSTVFPSLSIPNFITNELLKMQYGSYLTILLYVVLFVLYGLLILVPYYMIYKQENFLLAAKHSTQKMIHQPKLWMILIGIFLLYYVLQTYIFKEMLLTASDFNFYFLRYFLFSSYFRVRTFGFIAFSILWTIIEVFFIKQALKTKSNIDPVCSFEPVKLKKTVSMKSVIVRHKIIYSILFSLSCLIFVIYYFNQQPILHLPYSIGHRGDISQPENSLEGILAADTNHADFAEIDIQLTKDNVLVLCHDTNLKRLTGKDVDISELTLDEIQQLKTTNQEGKTAKIPTLEEAIQTAKNAPNQIGLLIEFKPLEGDQEKTVSQTIELIEKYEFSDRSMFMSMDQKSMQMMAKKRPDWWIGYCAFGNLGRINIRLDDPFIPDFIAIEESAINTQLLEDARNNILPVYVWTVDDTEKVTDYLNMGVSGIIGDASDQVAYSVDKYETSAPKDDFHYVTTCPGFPQLTEDEYGYIQCPR